MANEKRLIDANKFAIGVALYMAENAYLNDTALDVLKKVSDWLDKEPTVDAVEVVHGEWVVCGDGEYVPFMCSACGKTTSWYHAQTANYCPNCGAKMDGDGNA